MHLSTPLIWRHRMPPFFLCLEVCTAASLPTGPRPSALDRQSVAGGPPQPSSSARAADQDRRAWPLGRGSHCCCPCARYGPGASYTSLFKCEMERRHNMTMQVLPRLLLPRPQALMRTNAMRKKGSRARGQTRHRPDARLLTKLCCKIPLRASTASSASWKGSSRLGSGSRGHAAPGCPCIRPYARKHNPCG